uniref:hypothetical protein n=1 Tax=Candidatus Ventrimonas sp. TaxID=3048889 RepID=UPI003FED52BD
MRKIQKILLGGFLAGVLICGVGAGTAIGEYSSLNYLGERTLGEEKLVTENFDYTFDPELGAIRLHPSWYGGRETAGIETDASVPENVIRYEITYLPETIEPELIFRPRNVEESLTEESEPEETAAEETTAEESEPEETAAEENANLRIQGDLLLETWYHGDLGIWMEAKDQILADLKDGRIAGYQVPHIKEITIKVNPVTAPYVIFHFQE